MESAVAADRDGGSGHLAARSAGEGKGGAGRLEDAVEVGRIEEVALGGRGAAHRLLVGGEESFALLRGGVRAGHQLDLIAGTPVLLDLVALAGAALARPLRVGDLA